MQIHISLVVIENNRMTQLEIMIIVCFIMTFIVIIIDFRI